MDKKYLKKLLLDVKKGARSPQNAFEDMKTLPFKDFGFAKLDFHRHLRKGFPEVVFCPGKTPQQVATIFKALSAKHDTVIATKAERSIYEHLAKVCRKAKYYEQAHMIVFQKKKQEYGKSKKSGIIVLTAGTADIPVAEEAAVHVMTKYLADIPKRPEQGEIVEGPVISADKKAVYIDMHLFGVGIIYGREYTNARDLIKHMNVGDVVTAKVV